MSWLADTYVELGWAPEAAGGLVALLNVGSLAGAVTAGLIGGRYLGLGPALVVLSMGFALATAGFVLLPALGPLWAVLAGYANGALFPLLLALPLPLAGSVNGVAGLSTVMIGAGYSLAATGPIVLGAVRDATGSFHASLLILVVVAAAFAASLPFRRSLGGTARNRHGRLGPSFADGDRASAALGLIHHLVRARREIEDLLRKRLCHEREDVLLAQHPIRSPLGIHERNGAVAPALHESERVLHG